MATFTSAAVTNRTGNGCTITFNAAAIDVNAAQLKQLYALLGTLIAGGSAGNEGGNSGATITIGAFG